MKTRNQIKLKMRYCQTSDHAVLFSFSFSFFCQLYRPYYLFLLLVSSYWWIVVFPLFLLLFKLTRTCSVVFSPLDFLLEQVFSAGLESYSFFSRKDCWMLVRDSFLLDYVGGEVFKLDLRPLLAFARLCRRLNSA